MGFVSLYTAYSGLNAAQAGMDTASHNVANAANPGYSRQQVTLATRMPFSRPFGVIGTGVDVTDISRIRSVLLDQQYRSSADNAGRLSTLTNLLSTLEGVTGEPDHGITTALTDLWGAFEDLALDPPDPASRLNVLDSLDALATRIQATAEGWDATTASASTSLASKVDEVNAVLARVASLNSQIMDNGLKGGPNDLLDARDELLDRLSNMAGVSVHMTDGSGARVSIGGIALVEGATMHALTYDLGTYEVTTDTGTPVTPGGEIAGFRAFLTDEVPALRGALDGFTSDLAAALNTQHAAGFTPAGAAGGPLLSFSAGAEALTISVAVTSIDDLAASGTAGPPVPLFDATNVNALAGLRDALVASGASITLDAAARGLVTNLASSTQAAATGADSNTALMSSARQAKLSVSGVNLDEEMVNLMHYQRTYEASARVMTAVDQMLDTLINGTGIAGR